MNAERKAGVEGEGAREITDVPATRHLGHFALRAVDDALGTAEDMALPQAPSGSRFSLSDPLSSLAYARAVAPCPKLRTFADVLPQMEGIDASFTLDQPCDGLAYLGDEYEKVVEIYNAHADALFGHDMSSAYFDCTNLYFEIDREDGFRGKGPSKEHRPEPIVGMGLLLDADCIPVAMSLFPGNESERPQLGRCIAQMRERNSMSGRTVRVADKGLDCAANIAEAVLAGDGYIFSKSARALPAKERAWALSADGWTDVPDGKGGTSFRYKMADGDFGYAFEGEGGRRRKAQLPERRVVTYSPSLAKKQTYEISRQVEKARPLRAAAAKRSEYGDSARHVTFSPADGEGEARGDMKVAATLNHEAIRKAKAVAGYNMTATSKTGMDPRAIYDTYHRLWRIEESLGVMKSELDAVSVN
ncbi:transposase [Olsenella sp. Marseille-P4559]|uniref:IS1634 family transposase n=1 Tax=Olsenella sp. Marseille-P4559 TaxID=2364795 RepID=UPI001030451D|nr:transposase [Olsenella sp. Marseille-P4559]